MSEPICFMQTSGLHITSEIADMLYQLAIEMVNQKAQRLPFEVGEIGEGLLTTRYKTVAIGCRGGLEFRADIAIESRQFEVSFILDDRYLKEALPMVWIEVPLCEMPTSPSAHHQSMLN